MLKGGVVSAAKVVIIAVPGSLWEDKDAQLRGSLYRSDSVLWLSRPCGV